MLKSQAIVETLVEGCVQGTFVLRLPRPDRTYRTWWRARPDSASLNDSAMELVLPQAAELTDIDGDLLAPNMLPGLWNSEEINVQHVMDYFNGSKVVQVDRGEFQEPVPVPKATAAAIDAAITHAVASGKIWLLSGPASLLAESIPAGVLSAAAILRSPPSMISAAAILPETLPDAWKENKTNGLAIAAALSQQSGRTLPWKTVRDAIGGAAQARFIALAEDSGPWPCDFAAASTAKFKLTEADATGGKPPSTGVGTVVAANPKLVVAETELEPSAIQDLSDIIPQLLAIKMQANAPLVFRLHVEFGNGIERPAQEHIDKLNEQLEGVKEGFKLK
jgi:hypothetical protein